jgi:hypothetical protein
LQRKFLRNSFVRLYIWFEEEKGAKERREICLTEVTLNRLDQEKCMITSDEFTWLEGLNRRRVSTHFRASATEDWPSSPPSRVTTAKSFSNTPSKARTFGISVL